MFSRFLIVILLLSGITRCNWNLERDDLQVLAGLGLFRGSPVLRLGGEVVGLASGSLSLDLQVGESVVETIGISRNGAFEFERIFSSGEGYTVRIATQPDTNLQTCQIFEGSGVFERDPIRNLRVVCDSFPRVVSFNPRSFSSIGREEEIRIRFSESIEPDTCRFTGSLLNAGFSIAWESIDQANDQVILRPENVPSNRWNLGVSLTVQVTDCESGSGLGMLEESNLASYFVSETVGAIRFVGPGGTDTGTCENPLSPCATIPFAYSQIVALNDCATNLDCAVLVQSGSYSPASTISIQTGRSIIGSFNSDYTVTSVFTNPTNINANAIDSCGATVAQSCETIQAVGVGVGTRLETIRVVGKNNVQFARTLSIRGNSNILLRTVLVRAGDSNVSGARSHGLYIDGNNITVELDTGIYTTGTLLTDTTTESAAIRIVNANSLVFTSTGSPFAFREAGTRYGLRMTGTSPTSIAFRFFGTQLNQTATPSQTINSVGISMEGNLSNTDFEMRNMDIRAFQTRERSVGFEWTSSANPTGSVRVGIFNNRIQGGRILVGTSLGSEAFGIKANRLSGYILNNSIIGGSNDTGNIILHAGMSLENSSELSILGNSIVSGSGNQIQDAIQWVGSDNTLLTLQNNNLASNTNPGSNCMRFGGVASGSSIRNNNFHSCSGAHIQVLGQEFFRSNCAGEPGQEGNLATAAGCDVGSNRLSGIFPSSEVSGNIDVNASFRSFDPSDASANVGTWNLNLRNDGTTPCTISRGAKILTGLPASPIDLASIGGRDRNNQNRTLTDTTGIPNLPQDGAGISIGAYEWDGACAN